MFKRLFLLTISLFLVSSSFAVKKEFRPYYNTAKQLNNALKKYSSSGFVFKAGLLDVQKTIHGKDYRGFVDGNGKLVIPCIYDAHPEHFCEGLPLFDELGFNFVLNTIGSEHKFGCIDTLGNLIIPFNYDQIKYNSSSNCFNAYKRCNNTDSCFTFDRSGNLLQSGIYKDLRLFYCWNNDTIECPCKRNDRTKEQFYPGPYCFVPYKHKFLMIDSMGLHLNEILFSSCVVYDDLFANSEHQSQIAVSVASDSGKELWGVVNKYGRMIIPCVYDSLRDFQTGYYVVSSQGHNSVVDSLNNVLCPLPDSLDFHSLDMVAIPNRDAYLLDFSEKVWLFDENRQLTELPYLNGLGIWPFSNGYAEIVKTDFEDFPAPPPPPGEETSLPTTFKREKESWGYMDANLNIVVPCIFSHVCPVAKNGLTQVSDGENWFFIDIRKAAQIKH